MTLYSSFDLLKTGVLVFVLCFIIYVGVGLASFVIQKLGFWKDE